MKFLLIILDSSSIQQEILIYGYDLQIIFTYISKSSQYTAPDPCRHPSEW